MLSLFPSGVKTTIFALIAASLISYDDPRNPLGIPAAIEATVALGQLFALIIAICTQDDLITALNLFHDGYSPSIREAFDGGSFGKWLFAASLLLFQGMFGLIVTFLLIGKPNTVWSIYFLFGMPNPFYLLQ